MVQWRCCVSEKLLPISTLELLKNRLLQPGYLLRIVTQLVFRNAGMPSAMLGGDDKFDISFTQLLRSPLKWRENNDLFFYFAKMTSRSRKNLIHFFVTSKRNKTRNQNHTSLRLFRELDCRCHDFEPRAKDEFLISFWNFQGPVIKV